MEAASSCSSYKFTYALVNVWCIVIIIIISIVEDGHYGHHGHASMLYTYVVFPCRHMSLSSYSCFSRRLFFGCFPGKLCCITGCWWCLCRDYGVVVGVGFGVGVRGFCCIHLCHLAGMSVFSSFVVVVDVFLVTHRFLAVACPVTRRCPFCHSFSCSFRLGAGVERERIAVCLLSSVFIFQTISSLNGFFK